ncbi:MAG: hypothetical protein ABI877_13445 [Gemmatimonadaceae bacterium]
MAAVLALVACENDDPVAPKKPKRDTPDAAMAIRTTTSVSLPACTIHWKYGVSGEWSNVTNWDTGVAPGPNDRYNHPSEVQWRLDHRHAALLTAPSDSASDRPLVEWNGGTIGIAGTTSYPVVQAQADLFVLGNTRLSGSIGLRTAPAVPVAPECSRLRFSGAPPRRPRCACG